MSAVANSSGSTTRIRRRRRRTRTTRVDKHSRDYKMSTAASKVSEPTLLQNKINNKEIQSHSCSHSSSSISPISPILPSVSPKLEDITTKAKPKLVTMKMKLKAPLPLFLKQRLEKLPKSKPIPVRTRGRARTRSGIRLYGNKTIKFYRNKIKFNDEMILMNDRIAFWDGKVEVRGILSNIDQEEKKLSIKLLLDETDENNFIERQIYYFQLSHQDQYICLDKR